MVARTIRLRNNISALVLAWLDHRPPAKETSRSCYHEMPDKTQPRHCCVKPILAGRVTSTRELQTRTDRTGVRQGRSSPGAESMFAFARWTSHVPKTFKRWSGIPTSWTGC